MATPILFLGGAWPSHSPFTWRGTISGAHVNPAVTLALAATKRFPWSKVPHYIVAQFAGAFVGALLLFINYHAKWILVDPNLDHTAPIVIGLIVVAIGLSFGGMNGYAINPARDLGPRLFAVVAGFENDGLTDGTGVWLPPVIGPIIGGLLGGFAYDIFIGKALISAHAINAADRASGEDPTHHEAKKL